MWHSYTYVAVSQPQLVSDCWSLLVAAGHFWWLLVTFGDCWSLLVAAGHFW